MGNDKLLDWEKIFVITYMASNTVILKKNESSELFEFLEVKNDLAVQNTEDDIAMLVDGTTRRFLNDYQVDGEILPLCIKNGTRVYWCFVEPTSLSWGDERFEIMPQEDLFVRTDINQEHVNIFRSAERVEGAAASQ